MSFYLCKHAKLEAQPVMLAGEQYYAVDSHGKGHLVHGPAFDLLFQPIAAVELRVDEVADVATAPCAPIEVRRQKTSRKIGGNVVADGATGARRAPKGEQAPAKAVSLPNDPKSPAKRPRVAPEAKASPLQQKVLDVLANGPLTTADLATMVYTDLDRKTACMNIYPCTASMREKGLIEKREDPTAGGLMKWYAV